MSNEVFSNIIQKPKQEDVDTLKSKDFYNEIVEELFILYEEERMKGKDTEIIGV
ncbi:3206_t:CDS:2 [Scutellospora calospora]|uniref:3206_t:CDS:1 n=1 Tax=Scutellospora calospora TaxID=85575 RepID=A0ACA9KLG5_9GLOM|nr:3206_t:CDS:2 [Scutellospora calospora]